MDGAWQRQPMGYYADVVRRTKPLRNRRKWGTHSGLHDRRVYGSTAVFQKLYDEGLINKDFAVMDSAKWNDPIIKGKAGVIVDTGSRASQIQSAMEEADPANKDVIDVTGTVKGPKGTYTFPTSGYAGMIAIPKASVKTEKELKEVLGFLDKMNDEEAQIIANNGIKGRNYKLENGTYTSLEKNNKKTAL